MNKFIINFIYRQNGEYHVTSELGNTKEEVIFNIWYKIKISYLWVEASQLDNIIIFYRENLEKKCLN